ncbi:hypothetical protein JD844_022105 [Phrynosoma platyrhinos]|uniref:SRCR domain-containing protein n=1 Tax=Phrynosoma platyrhinos TaxID=52577 RepID=A0ABQ7SUU3_PHRPL|nr:hypothetical protein JD844_022105 [Phrynosoma platyrhinos]
METVAFQRLSNVSMEKVHIQVGNLQLIPHVNTTMIRLEDGTMLCSGTVELKFGGHWEMVSLGLQRWWEDLAPRVCKGAGCEDAIGVKDLGSKKPLPIHWEKVQCERKNLSLDCLNRTKPCFTLVKCSGQDFKPNPSKTEAILRILLGLVLTTFLLITCVLPTYKKIMKKYFKKRQHQWIGPNAVNQNALEGATNRISNPLDNSSDSDYDLCSAQQL